MRKKISYHLLINCIFRNADWMYCTKKGRKILAKQTGRTRLIIVRMFQEVIYGDMMQIQNDLHEFVIFLKPKNFTDSNVYFF